jgi:hypothetical protein
MAHDAAGEDWLGNFPAVSIYAADGDGDEVSIALNLDVQDDIPVVKAEMGSETVELEEESVPGLDGNDEPDGYSYIKSDGDITDNVDWGADDFGAVTKVVVGGTEYLMPDTAGDDSVTIYFDADGASQGTTATGAAASLLVNEDGTYSVEVLDAMAHDAAGEDWLGNFPAVSIYAADGDGDEVSIALNLDVQDDIPSITANYDAILANEQGNSLSADLDVHYGADGAAATNALAISAPPVDGDGHAVDNDLNVLTSDGTALIYQSDGSGGWIAVTDDTNHTPVFEVSVDAGTETYSVNIVGTLDGAASWDIDLATGDHTGGNDYLATFEADIDGDGMNDVRITATASTNGGDIGDAKVNFNAHSIGVDTGNDIAGDDSDVLHVEFTDPADDSHLTYQTLTVGLEHLDSSETGWVQAYIHDNGTLTPVGSPIELDGNLGLTHEITPGGDFDTLEFTAAEGSTYKVASISGTDYTEGVDHTVTFEVTAEDGDGDTASDTFDVSFDGDGILHGDTGHSEVIVGGSGVDTIYADDGAHDIIDGGAGADIIDIDNPVEDSIDTLVNPDPEDSIS